MAKGTPRSKRPLPAGLVILYEDADLLVVDKPAGLLTIATERERDRTAYYFLMDYVRKGVARSRNRIFIVHRLDRETSGVLIFAKNETAKRKLQEDWDQTEKKYLAVVRGKMKKPEETISSYLTENKALVVHSTNDTAKGKLSHTAYKVLKETKHLSLLEVTLLTGRKHQIRVHLAEIGHAVVGDRKYGENSGDENRKSTRLALHALSIAFEHPMTGKRMVVSTVVPASFEQLVGRVKQ